MSVLMIGQCLSSTWLWDQAPWLLSLPTSYVTLGKLLLVSSPAKQVLEYQPRKVLVKIMC